jgi:hypothetical protein
MVTMDTQELVRQWKQPNARRDGALVDHPSGGIVLRSGGGLARRAGLLAAQATIVTPSGTHTMSGPTFTDPSTGGDSGQA